MGHSLCVVEYDHDEFTQFFVSVSTLHGKQEIAAKRQEAKMFRVGRSALNEGEIGYKGVSAVVVGTR